MHFFNEMLGRGHGGRLYPISSSVLIFLSMRSQLVAHTRLDLQREGPFLTLCHAAEHSVLAIVAGLYVQ